MKKIIEQLKNNRWIHYAIIIIVGIILCIPIKDIQIRETHDGAVHFLRLVGTLDALEIGEIPPIIAPDFCNGTGYAVNLFYPPLVTYIPLLFKLFLPTYSMALKLFGAICIILSGITMYNFVYQVTNKKLIALFSGIIYLIAPYKLGNVYKRYAIGEFAALIFLPVLFQGLYNLFKQDGKKHYYITIGAVMLMLSHTLTTFYTAIICVIYIMFYIPKLKDKSIIKKLVINTIFIILITALFWMPMLETRNSAQYAIFVDEIMSTNSSYVHANSLELSEFFKDIGEENATTYIIGIPILVLFVLTLYATKKVDIKYKDIYVIFILFSVISLYLTTKYFPWQIMPNFLCKLQYPWRMLGFFNFFSSLICAVNLYIIINQFIKRDWIKIIFCSVFLVICLCYTLPKVTQYKAKKIDADQKYETSILQNHKISHMSINRDYLPVRAIYVQNSYMKTRGEEVQILDGVAEITSQEKEKLNMSICIANAAMDTCLEFPYIYYPGYEITIGNEQRVKPIESRNGYIAIRLPQDITEETKITIEYKGTNLTKVSYVISLISFIIFIVYIISQNKKYKAGEI